MEGAALFSGVCKVNAVITSQILIDFFQGKRNYQCGDSERGPCVLRESDTVSFRSMYHGYSSAQWS